MQTNITRDELKRLIDREEDVTIVETLPEEKFRESHIAGAVSLPVDQIEAKASQALPDKSAQIVTYCGGVSCDASKKGAEALRKLGYANVREYTEGKEDWKSAGYPLEGSSYAGTAYSTSERSGVATS